MDLPISPDDTFTYSRREAMLYRSVSVVEDPPD